MEKNKLLLRDERSWKSKKVSSSAAALGLLRAAPGVIKVVCCNLIPVIIIDDYRRAALGDGVWDFRGTLVGRGSIDLLPWIPVNNIEGLNAPTHVDGVETEVHVERRAPVGQRDTRTNKAFRCRLRISHMHHLRRVSSLTPQILIPCM